MKKMNTLEKIAVVSSLVGVSVVAAGLATENDYVFWAGYAVTGVGAIAAITRYIDRWAANREREYLKNLEDKR